MSLPRTASVIPSAKYSFSGEPRLSNGSTASRLCPVPDSPAARWRCRKNVARPATSKRSPSREASVAGDRHLASDGSGRTRYRAIRRHCTRRQRLSELCGCPEPVGGNRGERLNHRPLHRIGHRRADPVDARYFAGETLRHDRLGGGAGVRWLAGEHFVQHHTERVDVGSRIYLALAGGLLGTHVGRCADHDPGFGEPFAGRRLPQGPSDAEIGHHRLAIAEQDVLGLDVAVNHTVAVGIVEGEPYLAGDSQGVLDRELPLPRETLPQRFALDEWHSEPELRAVLRTGVGLAGVVHRDDMRVLEPRRELDLPEEALGAQRVGQLRVEELERDRAVMAKIVSKVDSSHTPTPELALDAVPIGKGDPQRSQHVGHLEKRVSDLQSYILPLIRENRPGLSMLRAAVAPGPHCTA